MEQNFTPLDATLIKKNDFTAGMVLLIIATFTALILASILFILIQKKIGTM